MTMTFEIYKDSRKKFRWRLRAKNNKVIADCAEAYNQKRSALAILDSFAPLNVVVKDKTLKKLGKPQ